VPAYESGPFVSHQPGDPEKAAQHEKLTLNGIGSSYVYSVYDTDATTYALNDYLLSNTPLEVWWFKATIAVVESTQALIPPPSVPFAQVYRGIAVPAGTIQQMLMYMDTYQDVPFVALTSFRFERTAEFLNLLIDQLHLAAEDVLEWALLPNFEWPLPLQTEMGQFLQWLLELANSMYAPFGIWDTQYAIGNDDLFYASMFYACNFRGPLYLPSVLVETLAIHVDSVILKTINGGVTRTCQYIHMATFPSTTGAQMPIPIDEVASIVDQALNMMRLRRYMKLNYLPENRPAKALAPYTAICVPADRNGQQVTIYSSPYEQRYIDDHNLQILTTCFIWPTLVLAPVDMVATMTTVAMKQSVWYDVMHHDGANLARVISCLMLDASYGSDGCELDAYFDKMRHSYLGFWQVLAGLLPNIISSGANLIKGILKPSTTNSMVGALGKAQDVLATVSSVSSGAGDMVKLAQAGLRSMQVTTPGPPSDGMSLDLPLDRTLVPKPEPQIGKKSMKRPRVVLLRRH
jgi:hypothetical protein